MVAKHRARRLPMGAKQRLDYANSFPALLEWRVIILQGETLARVAVPMYRERVFWFLVAVIQSCESLELNITGCVKDCKDKLNYKETDRYVCDMRCLQDSLGELVKKDYYERTLPKPAAPRLVEAGWKTIQLRFNTTELERYSDLDYILEVKPHWGPQERNNIFVVFPFTKIYHNTTQTTYTVKDLETNTGYQFRVIAIKLNKSSPYSNWSNVIKTNKTCKKLPCGATNIRLELRTRKPYQKDEKLKSEFHWKPIQLSKRNKTQLNDITQELSSVIRNPNCKLGEYLEKSSYSDIASNSSNENQQVYYDCWYKLKMAAADDGFWPEVVAAQRSWIFHVPKCIRINNDEICGCPPYVGTVHVKGSINARITRDTSNNNVKMFLNWNDATWKNVENFTYFKVQIRNGGKVIYKDYVDATPKVYQHNKTIFNLTYGMEYYLGIYGYHGHHCLFQDVEALAFKATPPCENANCSMRKPNSICQPDGYGGKHKCICDDGFYSEGNKCIDKDPCRRNPCGRNQKCTPIVSTGGRNCICEKNFSETNETCVPVVPIELLSDYSSRNVYTKPGDRAVLVCSLNETVQWRKDGKIVTNNKNIKIFQNLLVVNSTDDEIYGEYFCELQKYKGKGIRMRLIKINEDGNDGADDESTEFLIPFIIVLILLVCSFVVLVYLLFRRREKLATTIKPDPAAGDNEHGKPDGMSMKEIPPSGETGQETYHNLSNVREQELFYQPLVDVKHDETNPMSMRQAAGSREAEEEAYDNLGAIKDDNEYIYAEAK